MKINYKKLIISFVIVYGIAFLGSLFTDTSGWYDSIKPNITPPNYVFPIVWNILFFLIALGLYISWNKNNRYLLILFFVNLALNLLWSILFFKLKMPILSFVEIILLWISILFIILYSWKFERKISYLILPYLIWVSFAIVLNFLIAF